MFRRAIPIQRLVNYAIENLVSGLEQYRPHNGICRAPAEREKLRFIVYWQKAEAFLTHMREEMRSHRILVDLIDVTTENIIDRTQLEPIENI